MSREDRFRELLGRAAGGAYLEPGINTGNGPVARNDAVAQLGMTASQVDNGRLAAALALALCTGERGIGEHFADVVEWVCLRVESGDLPMPRKHRSKIIYCAAQIGIDRFLQGRRAMTAASCGFSRDSARRALEPIADAVELYCRDLEQRIISEAARQYFQRQEHACA